MKFIFIIEKNIVAKRNLTKILFKKKKIEFCKKLNFIKKKN